MYDLKSFIADAEKNRVAIGHFNISELGALKAIAEVAKELNLPIIIGTSEGERDFIGVRQAVALVKSLREEYNFPIFINADHTHSLEKVKEAVEAGYDAILFDPFDPAQGKAGKLPLEENIKKTREVVEYVKSQNPKILVEGELGYIGSSSVVFKELPKGAAIEELDLTKPEEAAQFVKETGVDLLAPAVGNIHGILSRTNTDLTQTHAENPPLNIARIKEIKEALRQAPASGKPSAGRQGKSVPLVLHGGSGTRDEDFIKAIEAGISIIHINTELRVAWRRGLEKAFKESPEEVTPYKLMQSSLDAIKTVVYNRLRLFNRM